MKNLTNKEKGFIGLSVLTVVNFLVAAVAAYSVGFNFPKISSVLHEDVVKNYDQALNAVHNKLGYNQITPNFPNTGPNPNNQQYCIPGDSTACGAPIGEWNFEEASGTSVNDTSGNANTGILTNNPTWGPGKIGTAINFDGTNDYVDMGNNTLLGPTTISFSMWINPKSYPTGINYAEAMRKENSYEVEFIGPSISSHPSTLDVGVKTASSNPAVYIPFASIPLNTWSHIALTADGSNVKVYLNGTQYGSTSYSGNIDNIPANHLFIGTYGTASPTLDRWFNGQVDQVRVFNYARSGAQVALDYSLGL